MSPVSSSLKNPLLTCYDTPSLNQNLFDLSQGYQTDGILHLGNFLNQAQLKQIRDELTQAEKNAEEDLRKNWDDQKIFFYSKNAAKEAKNSQHKEYVTEPYFLKSADRTHVFYEMTNGTQALNRMGHGLHLQDTLPSVKACVYHHEALQLLLKTIGYLRPVCHLSIYIPKHSNEAGSDVRPHQESTFAYTDPLSVTVLWIALEDATIENACMWGVRGSNQWPLKFVSRVNWETRSRTFETLSEIEIPDFNKNRSRFIPLEAKAGDAFIFHGNFIHCSPINSSSRGRPALSFQFIETDGVKYSESNWLQPPNNLAIYDQSAKETK